MSRPIAIDTHHHIAPKLLLEASKQRLEAKPFLQPKGEFCSWHTQYMWLIRLDISTAERLRYLDFSVIRTAVTSISYEPHFWQGPGAFEPSELSQFMQALNDEQLDMVRAHPSRFGAFAALPLPNVEGAVAEIQRLTSHEGLRPDGFAAATAHGGKYIGDPTFASVLKELDRVRAVLFIHPAETIMWACLMAQTDICRNEFHILTLTNLL